MRRNRLDAPRTLGEVKENIIGSADGDASCFIVDYMIATSILRINNR